MLPPKAYQAAKTLVLSVGVILIGVVLTIVIGYVMASPTFGWTGAQDPDTSLLSVSTSLRIKVYEKSQGCLNLRI